MSLTRYHFVSGLPRAGARLLAQLLSQNPTFQVTSDGMGAALFGHLLAELNAGQSPIRQLDADTGTALLRSALDAVHQARPMEATVLDHNADWLPLVPQLAEVFPLSRFVLMVRDPAGIAADLAQEQGQALSPAELMAPEGLIGGPLAAVKSALNGPSAKQVLLIDRELLLRDPIRVLNALYGFLTLPVFDHDMRTLPESERDYHLPVARRRFAPPSDVEKGGRGAVDFQAPVWRRIAGSGATMLLREAG